MRRVALVTFALLAVGCEKDEECVRPQCGPCFPALTVTVITDGTQPPLPKATVSITYADGSAVDFICWGGGEANTYCTVRSWQQGGSTYLIHAETPGYAPADLAVPVKADGSTAPECGCWCGGYVHQEVEMHLEPTP